MQVSRASRRPAYDVVSPARLAAAGNRGASESQGLIEVCSRDEVPWI